MKCVFRSLLFALLLGCNKHDKSLHTAYGTPIKGTLITKAQYGSSWPYYLDSLYLFRGEKLDVYMERGDTIYAVNSTASDLVDSGEFGTFQQGYLVVKNATAKHLKTKEAIIARGLKQPVNMLPQR